MVSPTPPRPKHRSFIRVETNGGIPQLTGGGDWPSHDLYGAGTDWQEFRLGDVWRTDSPVADFIGVFPTEMTPDAAQINVYEISVSGIVEPTLLHFDAYDSVQARNGAKCGLCACPLTEVVPSVVEGRKKVAAMMGPFCLPISRQKQGC